MQKTENFGVNANVFIHYNESLKNLCRANGFCLVNDNISECKHRLHLLETGKYILANNFMNGINNYFSLKYRQNNHFRHKIQTRVLIP